MRIGDRVVVLASERRGTIHSTDADGAIWVTRDDLPLDAPPIPYDPFELEVCAVPNELRQV